MGYNGNNRKLRSSVIKKSSLKYGDRIVSNLFAWPIALGAAFLIDSIDSMQNSSSTSRPSSNNNLPSKCASSILCELSNAKYAEIKDKYDGIVLRNIQIGKSISDIKKQISRISRNIALFGFITSLRTKYEKKKSLLEREIKTLNSQKAVPVISLKNFIQDCTTSKIVMPSKSNVYLSTSPISEYTIQKKLECLKNNNDSGYFKIDTESIISLKFNSYQLYFYENILILETKSEFAIFEYADLVCSFDNIHIYLENIQEDIDDMDNIQKTWLHTCKDGSPDMRYSYNPIVYDVIFSHILINIYDSIFINLLFSDKYTAESVYSLISQYSEKEVQNGDIAEKDLNQDVNSDIMSLQNNDMACLSNSYPKDRIASLTESQLYYVSLIKNIGIQKSKYICSKRPQIGSYVLRRRDNVILVVIGFLCNGYICYDFDTDECYNYDKDDLVIY